jgi:hypothetical protein
MAEVQLPNCTGSSTTWFAIAGSTLVKAQCGSTPGTDLVCDTE